jgi:DNA-binding NarL/FixJ family response regulator
MDAPSYSLVLIEDHVAFADALSLAFQVADRFRVVAKTRDATLGYEVAMQLHPDVVVADIEQPGRSIFDMFVALRKNKIPSKFVVLSAYCNSAFIEQALRTRVDGYLLKTESFESLCNKLERVMRGERVFSQQIADLVEIDPQGGYRLKVTSKIERLSDRQIDVVRLLARGYSVKEIAKEMHLSAKTVDSHKYRVMKMLDLHDRLELARFARDAGIVVED